jgi:hypothetical protein
MKVTPRDQVGKFDQCDQGSVCYQKNQAQGKRPAYDAKNVLTRPGFGKIDRLGLQSAIDIFAGACSLAHKYLG